RRGGVHPELAEVRPHALPDAARRDAERLVVVAVRAARGEGVAQPEAVLGRQQVGDVGEGGRALVGRDHQVRILLVVDDEAARMDDEEDAYLVVAADKGTATFSDVANLLRSEEHTSELPSP